jgi:SOS response regulatory protein OraA/RecX
MATLKYVREIKDTKLLLLGIVGEGESADYTVSVDFYVEIGSPAVNDGIDDATMSEIKYADRLYKARKKALNILAYADNNRRALYSKLCRAGFDREICDKVCDEMIAIGYINEKNQLDRIITAEANQKLRGPYKIIPTLAAKGYSTSDVSSVMRALVDSGEIDFSRNARLLVEKKLPDISDSEEKKKLLYKNGYKI